MRRKNGVCWTLWTSSTTWYRLRSFRFLSLIHIWTNVEYAMRGTYDMLKAVIIPTFCDTLKCIVENMKLAMPKVPTIAMAYPQHRRLKAGQEFMVSELMRVRHELEVIVGKIITEEEIEKAFAAVSYTHLPLLISSFMVNRHTLAPEAPFG